MLTISSQKSSLVLTAILLTCCSPLATTTAWAMDPPPVAKGLVAQKKSKGPLMDAIWLYEQKKTENAREAFEKIASGGGTIAVVYLHKIDQKKYGSLFNDLPDYSKKLGKVHLDASLAYRDFKAASKNQKMKKLQILVNMMGKRNTHALTLLTGMYDDPEDKIYVSSLRKSKEDLYKTYKPMTVGAFLAWDCFDGDYLCNFSKTADLILAMANAFKEFETNYTKNPEKIVNIAKSANGLCPTILWIQLAIENGDRELCFAFANSLFNVLNLPTDLSKTTVTQASKPFSEDEKNYFDLSKYYLAHHLKLEDFPVEKKDIAERAAMILIYYANIYEKGFFGEKQNPTKQFFYFEKAADFGIKEFQYSYANYVTNFCDKPDPEKAFKYCALSADQGLSEAQNELAHMYYEGQGCVKNLETCLQWYKKSAESGNPDGQYACGNLYMSGEGTSQDFNEAFKYYTQAINNPKNHQLTPVAFANLHNSLGTLYYKGNGCRKDLAKAVEFFTKAADSGDAHGQYNLGKLYQFGEGVSENSGTAIDYFKKAEKQGHLSVIRNLASLLALTNINKSPASQDFDEAIFYNKKAADTQKKRVARIAEYNCSVFFLKKGGPENLKQALHYSERAAEHGLAAAQYFYGCLLSDKEIGFYDLEKACYYLQLAANQGEIDALIRLNLLDELFKTRQSTATEDQSEFIEIAVPVVEEPVDSSDEEQKISQPVLPETQREEQAETPEINVNAVPQLPLEISEIKPEVPQIPLDTPNKPKKILPQEDSQEEDLSLARELALCEQQNAQKIRDFRVKKEKAKASQVLRLKRQDYKKTCTSFPMKVLESGEQKKVVVSNNTMEFVRAIFGQGVKINTFSNEDAKKAFAELGCTVAQKKGENSTILIYNLGGDREMELHYEERGEEENAPSTDQKAKYHNPHGHGDNKMYKALMPPLRRYLQSIGITPERLDVK